MNKGELVSLVAERTELTNKAANVAVTATIEAIMDAVASGEKVSIVGFGTIEPRERKEREGRNPKTGETMVIPASTVPGFKPGKEFKQRLVA